MDIPSHQLEIRCEICKYDIETNEEIVHCVSCESQFHKLHLAIWTRNNSECPNCREIFPYPMMQKLRTVDGKMINPALEKQIETLSHNMRNRTQSNSNVNYLHRFENKTCFVYGKDSKTSYHLFTIPLGINVCSLNHLSKINPAFLGIISLLPFLLISFFQINTTIGYIVIILISPYFSYLTFNGIRSGKAQRRLLSKLIYEKDDLRTCSWCDRSSSSFWSLISGQQSCSFKHLTYIDPYSASFFTMVFVLVLFRFFSSTFTAYLILIIAIINLLRIIIGFGEFRSKTPQIQTS